MKANPTRQKFLEGLARLSPSSPMIGPIQFCKETGISEATFYKDTYSDLRARFESWQRQSFVAAHTKEAGYHIGKTGRAYQEPPVGFAIPSEFLQGYSRGIADFRSRANRQAA